MCVEYYVFSIDEKTMEAIEENEKLKMYVMIEVKSLQTTSELQNAIEDNEVQLEEFQMQKKRIRELEVTIQEMKQLEEIRKTSSLIAQTSIISLPG